MTKGRKEGKGIATKMGPPEHFSGFKLAFLESKAALYQQYMDLNIVTEFYNKVTIEFIAKYGQDEPFNKEPAEDPPNPEDGVIDDSDTVRDLSKEEAEKNAVIFTKLRTKLAQWYRRKYKRVEATKSNTSSANPFMAVLAANIDKAPRKLTPFHQYLKKYYQSRVKEEYERRYAHAKDKYDNATKEERTRENMKKPVPLQIRLDVTREFWLLESQEFRDIVARDAEDTHRKEVEEWEASKVIPKTPQQFHQQLAFAGQYLHPVAKAIASQMQAAVSICIIGPVADRNGEVEVRSVHVNWPGGLAGATWPSHDPTGYSDAEKSMVAYGRANFSAAECQRRALPMQTQDVNEVDAVRTVEGVPSPSSHMAFSPPRMASPPRLLDEGLPRRLPAQPVPPSVTTTSSEEEANVTHPPQSDPSPPKDTWIPIDPVLLALSHPQGPQVAEPLPQREPREESPHPQQQHGAAVSPGSDSEEAPTITESSPVFPPVAPTSPPVFDVSPMWPQVPTSTPIVTPPPIPSDWPKHVVDAYRYLTEETVGTNDETIMRNWGDIWLGCLHAFIDFQKREGFPDGGPNFPPSTDVRPHEIAVWMKNGRRWKDVKLVDEKRFGQQWWDWWRSLQPKSRILSGRNHLISPTCEMDWSDLQKPGKNGFLLIVISLAWWGNASTREGSWLEAVEDVTDVLRCMHSASERPKANPLGVSSADSAASTSTSEQGHRGGGTAAGRPLKKRKVGR